MESLHPQILFTKVVVTIVEPVEKAAHVKSIEPTDLDMALLDYYVPLLFINKLEENSDAVYMQAVNRMKEGLGKVLVPFFPWAGRWVATLGGKQRQLLCNDKGIPFIQAYVDENMDSVVKISAEFQPVSELQGWDFLGMDKMTCTQRMQPDGLPCAFVQVTRFKCGGLVVGLTTSHMLGDGMSVYNFVTAWCDLSRANKTENTLDYNRGPAAQPSFPRPLPSADIKTAQSTEGKMQIYEVSASVIKSLKREVRESLEGAYVSTIDCIHAHLWKTVSSFPSSISGGKENFMALVVEGRTRFYDHPVPDLLGNIFTAVTPPKISSADLFNMPLSLIAMKTREKLKETARESWLSPEMQAKFQVAIFDDQIFLWVLSDWTGFPLYSVDFGFGKPLFATGQNSYHCGTSSIQCTVIIYPPTPAVSSSAACMDIWVRNPQLLEALERHPDFLPFFLPKENARRSIVARL